jgi:hypothetical protein
MNSGEFRRLALRYVPIRKITARNHPVSWELSDVQIPDTHRPCPRFNSALVRKRTAER